MSNFTPRIYVMSLSDYNAGKHHGCWIDLTDKDEDDVYIEIDYMLSRSVQPNAEEWEIGDTENIPDGIRPCISSLVNYAEALSKIDSSVIDAFIAFVDELDVDFDGDLVGQFNDSYMGSYDSINDFAFDLADNMGWLQAMSDIGINQAYFDIDQFAIDLERGGDYSFVYSTHDHEYHVFTT